MCEKFRSSRESMYQLVLLTHILKLNILGCDNFVHIISLFIYIVFCAIFLYLGVIRKQCKEKDDGDK